MGPRAKRARLTLKVPLQRSDRSPAALDQKHRSEHNIKRQSGAPSRMITIPGTSDHHPLEFVITISWND